MKNDLAAMIKRTRKDLGLNGESQQELILKVREAFDLSNAELAVALDVSLDTLLAYLATSKAKKFRQMPEADRLVLARILAGKRKR